MSTFRKALLTAVVKSLLRGKSLIQAILTYWIRPLPGFGHDQKQGLRSSPMLTIAEFLKEAEAALLGPVSGEGLAQLSKGFKEEFYQRLQNDTQCMLPSYSHQLPLGSETGQYLALDVGGSTLRVAVVELRGQTVKDEPNSEILSMRNFSIGKPIKDLEGTAFFDWMAARILETVNSGPPTRRSSPDSPLPMALAWSFPIEQTSLGGGRLSGMGKGFKAADGLSGQDLGDIVEAACLRQGLHVQLKAIVNDSSACLLSRVYTHTSTRIGLILGTGFNMAAYLPCRMMGRAKFGVRPPGWFDTASHVIVNTEMSMFGRKILPLTRWDHRLLDGHPRPDFQPLEYLCSGMYLGEIGRFALIEAIETTGIFGGIVPPSLENPYALSSETLSRLQSDDTVELEKSIRLFSERHPSTHTPKARDIAALRSIGSFIAQRSAALIASATYTLWDLRLEAQASFATTLPEASEAREEAVADLHHDKTMVSFNGSVIENFPDYRNNCQQFINQMVADAGYTERGTIELVPAKESSLLGAAVALACIEHQS